MPGREQKGRPREPLTPQQERQAAHSKALSLLSMRDYGTQELYCKLCERFSPESAAAEVARLQELELLDDGKYARSKARAVLAQNKSRREAERVLAQKGIDRALARQVLDEVWQAAAQEGGLDPEVRAICALLQRQYAGRLAAGRRDLVVAALARRGFPYGAIRQALAEQAEELPPLDEEFTQI